MKFSDIPVPEIYKESADFRFFLKWTELALTQIKYDIENTMDLYDPLRCPEELLWMLADTMGYKFDDRLPTAFNRLVLLYFMSMIHNRGCKNGLTLAAEVNLAQFGIREYGKSNEVLYNRLEDTSIPVNAVYVTPHTPEGYIDVVYFSTEVPTDSCIEYVRPLGMYCFQHSGVRVDARTKISIDARLTNSENLELSIGPTHVGHYTRADYASLQRVKEVEHTYEYKDKDGNVIREYKYTMPQIDRSHRRSDVYYRNSDAEGGTSPYVNPGFRALYSLQLANNEHIVKAMIPDKETGELVEPDRIFGLGYSVADVGVFNPQNVLRSTDDKAYNLLYNRQMEESLGSDVSTIDASRTTDAENPRPAVNPGMFTLGDAISVNTQNTLYSKATQDSSSREPKIERVDVTEN